MDRVHRQLALGRAPGLTAQTLRTALAATGTDTTLTALLERTSARLEALGVPAAAAAALAAPDEALLDSDWRWLERERVTLLDAADPHYPPLLLETPAAPALLYVRGDAGALRLPQLAMVGSRSPTESGRRTAREFAAYFGGAGLTITSGLAAGIDAASHEGALAAGARTVAVVGAGLDRLYPPEHRALAERIAAQGALVSELPPGTPPLRSHFPRRNRIISGLTLGTLVVEAARHSGSLITARFAADHGREVFAIPGSIHSPLARGCHALIRQGAKLVESADDVLSELKFSVPEQILIPIGETALAPRLPAPALDKDYKILLDALGFEPTSIDTLVGRTGLPSQSVASMLLILELEGAVGMQADGHYVRLYDAPRRAKS